MKPELIVVGNGMVGHHLLSQLMTSGAADNFSIRVFGEEPRAAYDRVHLSEYMTSRDASPLMLGSADDYRAAGIDLHLSEPVIAIDAETKQLKTAKGEYPFDKLVLATGSYPFVPPIPGKDQEHCLVYRTIEDLDAIIASAEGASRAVVVGGGLLGLEAANALKLLGLEAHVVEFAKQLMPVQLDEEGGARLRSMVEGLGVSVHLEKATQHIVAGDTHRLRMEFADESVLETDLIVFSAGVRPQDSLASVAGLELGERGGIVIDNHCITSHPDIYAIGECALWGGRIFGLVAPGYTMARVVASHLRGDDSVQFTGADMSTKLKLLGVDVGSIGDAHGRTPEAKIIRFADDQSGVYRKIVIDKSGEHLLGAVLIGDNSYYDTLLQYALNGIKLPANAQSLILPSGTESPSLGVDALPATASICSCHNVSKGDIVGSIDAGCCSLADVKSSTKASTGCGGCASLLKNVVDHELAARGVEVNTDLCEHFAHTRQELFHIVQVEGIKTFSELHAQYGRGEHGCIICKPAIASILATLNNEHVLSKSHVSLQDTNDTFMANMQKNGTYSVVPRIAGGEITPEMLITIGEVAKDFNLYTKITGGQRIDLFGAQRYELPLIWQRLVDAGFETGHAYGKSLRTVKSCVGSTWCRYGVQDSVNKAIEIENRYKGLRAPHKIKMAVSGCTRECAEAQSKDIGVIATDKGWNLYVCGNGGMKPRHADLFATDLDDTTLIRYIDRLLMFYCRTADRLQRTSVWMDNLDGGLDYLRQVVIEDSLGLGDELEAQMAHVVGTYACEWAETLKDPEKLKRFKPFVNEATVEPVQYYAAPMRTVRQQLIPALQLEEESAA